MKCKYCGKNIFLNNYLTPEIESKWLHSDPGGYNKMFCYFGKDVNSANIAYRATPISIKDYLNLLQ